jgi:hypothetical protein
MHRGAGTWEVAAAGGKPDAAPSWAWGYLATTQPNKLPDRVYITEVRRPEECEEGIGGPDREDRGRRTD